MLTGYRWWAYDVAVRHDLLTVIQTSQKCNKHIFYSCKSDNEKRFKISSLNNAVSTFKTNDQTNQFECLNYALFCLLSLKSI